VAGGEDEGEHVVVDGVRVEEGVRPGGRVVQAAGQLGVPLVRGGTTAEGVDGTTPSDGGEPPGGPVRDPVRGPARPTDAANEAFTGGDFDLEEILEMVGRFNEELIRAGVLLAAEGLDPDDTSWAAPSRGTAASRRDPPRRSARRRRPRTHPPG
jgi:hypothetical protein